MWWKRWCPGLLLDAVNIEVDQYRDHKERLRQTDMIVFANNHWNFNVRGFNPGGNHGAFFQPSTHAVMLFAGGGETGVPKGLREEEPYDSLSLVPTLLNLLEVRPEVSSPGPSGLSQIVKAAK